METLKQIIEGAGFFELGVIDTASLKFSHEVRGMCEVDSCHKYGKTWACPPGVGTVEECEARIKKYPKMIVFSGKYELEDSFDFEGMVESAKRFSDSCKNSTVRSRENLTTT